MAHRFYLLDVNEDNWEGKPCVKLWGVDEGGKRILVLSNQIMPYFYFLTESANIESATQMILSDKKRFPHVLGITVENKKLLGLERRVMKVTCDESGVQASYAEGIRKLLGKGVGFEHDLRLSVRYLTDLMLTPSGWNECEALPINIEDAVDNAYAATAAPRSISQHQVPELRILAFHVLTAGEKGSAKPETDPLRGIAIHTNSGTSALFLAEGNDDSQPLKDFTRSLSEFDPDIILGFESNRRDWPYLTARAKAQHLKLTVGRDSSEPHTSVFGHISVAGRANVDLSDIVGDIPEVKLKTLEGVVKYLALPSAKGLATIEEWDSYRLWRDETGRSKLIENAKMMVQACLELAGATIDFPMQLSALTGLPLDQVMAAAVGFRVDSYLVRQAHQIGELIPRRNEQPFFTYRGAIVLEPETGLHDNVAVLDFASMYPALMKKYNLSPDSLVKPGEPVPHDSVYIIPEVNHRFRKKPDGLYRTVLTTLINERAAIKKTLGHSKPGSTEYRVLKERERALKVVTNACYGYAGWAGARWYVREVAESATALGRETITKTLSKAKSLGLEIIYGDTDSIFVGNDRPKIDELLNWVKKGLEMDIKVEQVYVRVMFTEAMKRYAGLLPDGGLDIVGLEVVRGDWSEIARQVQERVVGIILRDRSPGKAVETVRTTIRKLKKGEVPITDLTIRKTLTKPIESYAVRAPHVEVARKLMKEGWSLTIGDKVGYVITKGPGKLFQKAKPFNQVKPEDVDIEYYLENQIKPAAMRILEGFGVNENQLAV